MLKAFTKNTELVSADYSDLELRALTSMTDEEIEKMKKRNETKNKLFGERYGKIEEPK